MPRMSSPDGSEVLTVPDAGVAPLKTLGWKVEDSKSSAESGGGSERTKRTRRRTSEPDSE